MITSGVVQATIRGDGNPLAGVTDTAQYYTRPPTQAVRVHDRNESRSSNDHSSRRAATMFLSSYFRSNWTLRDSDDCSRDGNNKAAVVSSIAWWQLTLGIRPLCPVSVCRSLPIYKIRLGALMYKLRMYIHTYLYRQYVARKYRDSECDKTNIPGILCQKTR